ncbi:unnamed protein product [Owenia fusiformis]|uniref:Uncharacterized protein n=1 Tax=Owenia fusiformis TaxID=6347 RepID=A0A8J1T4U8_OWEFU|nr:unnamed protein product [Owenia fusiformis]
MISVLATYFSKNLTLAVAIASSGVGIGTFIYPPLIMGLDSMYSWRGCTLILAAITLNICVCAAIIAPKNNPNKEIKPAPSTEDNYNVERVCDTSIFTNLNFTILCMNQLLYCFGHSILYVHFGEYAITMGVEEDHSVLLFSIIGISNLAGKIILGVISRFSFVNCILLYALTITTAGLLMLTIPIQTLYATLIASSIIFGVCSSAFGVLPPAIVCRFLGQNELPTGYGILCIFSAIGILPGAPIAGLLFDYTNHYMGSFYLGGSMIVISGISMVIPYIRTRHRLSHEQRAIDGTDLKKQSLLNVSADNNDNEILTNIA